MAQISVLALIVLVVIVVGSIAVLAWTIRGGEAGKHRDRSRHSGGLFAPLLVVALIAVLVFGWYLSVAEVRRVQQADIAHDVVHQRVETAEMDGPTGHDSSPSSLSPPAESEPPENGPILPNEDKPSTGTTEEEKAEDETTASDEPATSAPARPKSRVLSPPPSWSRDEDSRPSGETIVVSGSLATTKEEAEKNAYKEARRKVIRYFDRHRARETLLPKKNWLLTDAQLRGTVVRKTGYEEREHDFGAYQARMYRAYLQVELTPDVLDEIEPIWRRQAARGRLVVFAIGLGVLTALVAGSHVLLRVTGKRDVSSEGREL